METDIASRLRQYKSLPVFIEEDHHDVVPHIHRAIGSRHLPISGVTLVHFDSHPDLLLPVSMPADYVFNKGELYSSLSIENWILPLVYAGHVSEIYWLRPPWAQQIPSGHFILGVGKCKETGNLRMTCPDSYFLTEALYAPESHLSDMKQSSVHIITITPDKWHSADFKSRSPLSGAMDSDTNSPNKRSLLSYPADEGSNTGNCGNGQTATANSVERKRKACMEDSISNNSTGALHSEDCDDQNHTKLQKLDDEQAKVKEAEVQQTTEREKTVREINSSELPGLEWMRGLRDRLQGQPYILDIDLDFFSTKDPFRNLCTPEQTALLRELFGYQLPENRSVQVLVEFTTERRAQLEELERAFEAVQQDASKIPHTLQPHRQALFEKLITSLQSKEEGERPLDYQMIYHAGCTMDDTELPHHVSSNIQIEQLMASCCSVLEALPPPTVITIARSSEDDYCPKDQVDAIQEAMIGTLLTVYQNVDIKRLYEPKL